MENERLLKELTKSRLRRVRRWAETVQELNEYLSGRTPLGFLGWLRWLVFYIPFRAATSKDIDVSWWQAFLISIGLFIAVSMIDPVYRKYKVRSLHVDIRRTQEEQGFAEELKTEMERIASQGDN